MAVGAQQVYSIMALDIGEQRTGVALANSIAGIASPLTTITSEALVEKVRELVRQHDVAKLVVGLPRSLDGSDTLQTNYVRQVAKELEKQLQLPIHFIDEAVTSKTAEAELKARKKPYRKEDIDMLAATYILEDFLRESSEVTGV